MISLAHIGIAVSNLEEAIKKYSILLSIGPSVLKAVPEQKVKVAIFSSKVKEIPAIELLSPTDDISGVKKFIDKHGEGLHHIALKVENIEKRLAELKEGGFRLIDETPRIGAEGHKIAFIHPASCGGVLIELVEE
jgi:methylmalonyl-CoA/ethylmalonyl-CoA epimerase